MNLNDLAKEITLAEGLGENLSIAQVKELMKLIYTDLAGRPIWEIASILKKYQ